MSPETSEEADPTANDMVVAILREEEGHNRPFEGFLREHQDRLP